MKSDPNATILLVEDNDDDVFAMQRAMEIGKVTNPLQVVTDGKEAVDYLGSAGIYADREKFPMPFLIFLDLKLPYLSGFEILEWMRGQPQLESIIVVVLTVALLRSPRSRHSLSSRGALVSC